MNRRRSILRLKSLITPMIQRITSRTAAQITAIPMNLTRANPITPQKRPQSRQNSPITARKIRPLNQKNRLQRLKSRRTSLIAAMMIMSRLYIVQCVLQSPLNQSRSPLPL